MNEDYLWDRAGATDPEIVELERLLGPLRYRPLRYRQRQKTPWLRLLPIAAAVVLAMLGSFYGGRTRSAWSVGGESVQAGEWVRTDGRSTVVLSSDAVGEVRVDPDSALRVRDGRRLALRQGVIHALIWAPPSEFVVDTPGARAVDLGCAYTLSVDGNGDGLLQVETGWVAFDFEHRESFIPAGAKCRTYKGRGPGTPWFADAGPVFPKALRRFDETGDSAALDVVLENARARDGLTLWHLLGRGSAEQRRRAAARFAELIVIPEGVAVGRAADGEAAALDGCWNALGLGDTGWWRTWKRSW